MRRVLENEITYCRRLCDWLVVRLFEHAPSCAWVQLRLGAFCDWDLPLREFAAIEKHLHGCPECASECEDTRAIANIFRAVRGISAADEAICLEQCLADLMARIDAYEAERTGECD